MGNVHSQQTRTGEKCFEISPASCKIRGRYLLLEMGFAALGLLGFLA
jgi:hypothetical protein